MRTAIAEKRTTAEAPRGEVGRLIRSGAPLMLGWLREYPGNPRRLFRGIEELAAALKRDGQLEPIVVRPLRLSEALGGDGDAYEIADGARRFRAAKLAGLPFLRAEVRALDDREMLELAFGANVDRAGLHPIEEAEGYGRLYREHGQTIAEIAARRGVTERRVQGRLSLLSLASEVRAAFEEDRIGVGSALRLSRVAESVQLRAWRDLSARSGGGVVPEGEVVRYLSTRVFRVLSAAPFPTADAELVASAGACSACPKTSQRQASLFDDATPIADQCTDPDCWTAKRDAQVERLRAEKKPFLSPKEAAGVFASGTSVVVDGWVEVDKPYGLFSEPRKLLPRSLVELVGEKARALSVVAFDREGNPRLVVPNDAAWTLLRDVGLRSVGDRLRTPTGEQRKEADARAREGEKKERERVAKAEAEKALAVLVGRAGSVGRKDPIPDEFWRWLLYAAAKTASSATISAVFRRRGLAPDEDSEIRPTRADKERAILAEPNAQRCRALAVEVLAQQDAATEKPYVFRRAFEALGISLADAKNGKLVAVAPKRKR